MAPKQCPSPCDAAKVCNPKTARCVLRTGKIGREILGAGPPNATTTTTSKATTPKAATTSKACPPCDATKVCNPATARCVLRTGKIGRGILGGGAAAAPRKVKANANAPKKNFLVAARNAGAPPRAPRAATPAQRTFVTYSPFDPRANARLGKAKATAAAKSAKRPTPLTLAQVLRNWPKGVQKLSAKVDNRSNKMDYLQEKWYDRGMPWWYAGLPKFLGAGAEYLTRERVLQLVPNPGDTAKIVVHYEPDGSRVVIKDFLDPKKAFVVTLHRPASAAELWKYHTTSSNSARELFDVPWAPYKPDTDNHNYSKAKMPSEELARRTLIATPDRPNAPGTYGSTQPEIWDFTDLGRVLGYWGSVDGRFITWMAPGAPLLGGGGVAPKPAAPAPAPAPAPPAGWVCNGGKCVKRAAPKRAAPKRAAAKPTAPAPAAVVNASNRGTHKVPAGRGAPAGHAKNYANKTARGLDGELWHSTQVRSPKGYTWRWKKVR